MAKKRKRSRPAEASQQPAEGKSIRWIVIASMLLVAYIGWGMMAQAWATTGPGAEEGLAAADGLLVDPDRPPTVRSSRSFGLALLVAAVFNFVVTSVSEIPNVFAILQWHLTERLWVLVLIVLVEVLVAAGGYGLQMLEKKLETPGHRR